MWLCSDISSITLRKMADQFSNVDPTTLELIRKKIAEFLSGAGTEAKGVVTGLKDLATTNPIDTAKGMW